MKYIALIAISFCCSTCLINGSKSFKAVPGDFNANASGRSISINIIGGVQGLGPSLYAKEGINRAFQENGYAVHFSGPYRAIFSIESGENFNGLHLTSMILSSITLGILPGYNAKGTAIVRALISDPSGKTRAYRYQANYHLIFHLGALFANRRKRYQDFYASFAKRAIADFNEDISNSSFEDNGNLVILKDGRRFYYTSISRQGANTVLKYEDQQLSVLTSEIERTIRLY